MENFQWFDLSQQAVNHNQIIDIKNLDQLGGHPRAGGIEWVSNLTENIHIGAMGFAVVVLEEWIPVFERLVNSDRGAIDLLPISTQERISEMCFED